MDCINHGLIMCSHRKSRVNLKSHNRDTFCSPQILSSAPISDDVTIAFYGHYVSGIYGLVFFLLFAPEV